MVQDAINVSGYRFGNWLQLFPQGNTLGITRGKPIPNGQTIKENLTVFQNQQIMTETWPHGG